ncbi:MAG: tetratricopeptide repeat protein [Chloroflexi bacterium]|nr:tetratricopeptide repeat protein [Chloroflexota bacterium]
MNVQEMERRFFELKGKFDVGAMSEDDFKSEIATLRFQDKQNRWWMIGAQSGKWYMNDGARWLPGTPPVDEPPQPETPKESIESVAISPRMDAPASPEHLTTGLVTRTPAPLVTPPSARAAHLPRALPSLALTGPLLIIVAALAALIVVLIAWLVIDLAVPTKPISSFFAQVTNRTPAAVVPTSATPPAATSNIGMFLAQGDKLLAESRVDAAITQYQTASQLAPTNPAPLTRWSRALAMRGQLREALAKAQEAIARGAEDAEANAQLCRAQLWNNQVEDALRSCEKAIKLDAKSANAHAYLAEAYLHAGRKNDATAQAQLALQLAPTSAEAQRAQAWVLTLQGQKENAFAAWKQTTVLEPDSYFRFFEYGEALRVYLGNPLEAIPAYEKAVGLYGAYIPAIQQLGLALIEADKPLQAVPHLRRAITLDPNDADSYTYLGLAFGKANQCAQGIPYFDLALKLNPNSSLAQRGLADCRAGKTPALPPATPPAIPALVPTLGAPK